MSMQFLFDVIQERRDRPTTESYTSSLFAEGLPKIAQKVGEEASEVIVAALAQDDQRLIATFQVAKRIISNKNIMFKLWC